MNTTFYTTKLNNNENINSSIKNNNNSKSNNNTKNNSNNDDNPSLNLNYKDNNQSTKFEYKDTYNSYYLSIRDNNTGIFTEIYLTESEFNVIKTAIKYNNGIINLLGHKEEVNNLYRKGLIEISNDELEVLVVSDLILKLLSPKVLENRNILLSNNKDIHSNNKYKNNIDNVEEENKELGLDLGINNINNTYNNTYNNTHKTNNSINSINSTNSINSINSLFDGNEDEYLLEENRPNSIFKIFDNISVCFCCLL